MSILLQTIISAALALAGFILLLPTRVGERLIGWWFDERLEAFKAERNRELARLQEQLSHLTDRARLSNEREYNATAAAWESYVNAHFATLQCIVAYMTYPDLDQLSDEDLDHFLGSTDLSEREIADVKRATDKKTLYARVKHLHWINEAGRVLHDTRDLVIKQSVFIERDLQKLLDQNLERLTKAWSDESINFGMRTAQLHEAKDDLIKNGAGWLNELRTKVRERLLRNLTP